MNQVIDIHQLVQDVKDGNENPMKAFALLSEQLKEIKACIHEVSVHARQAHRDTGNKVVFLDGNAFTIDKVEGIGYEANEFHFADKTFVEWEEGNITCYQISGNYKAWKNGVKRKNGEVFFKDSPKGVSHIEKLINNGGY